MPEPAPTDPLASPDNLEAATRGRIPAASVGVEDALEAASEVVREFCGWHIAPIVTEEMILDGSGGRALLIPSMKIVELLSVIEEGQTLDLASIEVSASGILRRSPHWTHRFGGIRLTVTHGWEEPPAAVRRLVCAIATRDLMAPTGAVREQVGNVMIQHSVVSGSQGGGAVAGGSVLLAHEQQVLKRYVIPGRS